MDKSLHNRDHICRDLPDGMKIRGDINVLLMGDPGVAKSQLLKYISAIAPRGVYTTGKGSSGVGLTAAVVRDPLTGDLTLEGGALVLADMGICCIDEFDKMDENDRTAIHEVMEQQTISIAKAGITTTLNARASVLAAANPLYGRYNLKKSISENVDLPNSLLSRFDLLFLILDRSNMEKDLALSKHVLQIHKTTAPTTMNRSTTTTNSSSSANATSSSSSAGKPTISIEAFKQYIAAAKSFQPKIPKDLSNYIVEAYVELRIKDQSAIGMQQRRYQSEHTTNQAIMTARQLLSILRLSQALARLRLSDMVGHEDVDEAIRITHASKASLLEELNSSNPIGGGRGANSGSGGYGYQSKEQVVSDIYNLILASSASSKTKTLDYSAIETAILKAGYTIEQFQYCLSEYEALGVIIMDSARTRLSID